MICRAGFQPGVPCVFLVCLCAPIVAYAAVSSRPARNPDSPVAAMAPPPGSSNRQAVATDDASSHRLTVGVSLPETSGRAGCGRLAKVDSVPAMSVSRADWVRSRRRNKRCSPVWTAEAEAIPLCCLRITGPDGMYGLVVLRMPEVPQAGQRNAQ